MTQSTAAKFDHEAELRRMQEAAAEDHAELKKLRERVANYEADYRAARILGALPRGLIFEIVRRLPEVAAALQRLVSSGDAAEEIARLRADLAKAENEIKRRASQLENAHTFGDERGAEFTQVCAQLRTIGRLVGVNLPDVMPAIMGAHVVAEVEARQMSRVAEMAAAPAAVTVSSAYRAIEAIRKHCLTLAAENHGNGVVFLAGCAELPSGRQYTRAWHKDPIDTVLELAEFLEDHSARSTKAAAAVDQSAGVGKLVKFLSHDEIIGMYEAVAAYDPATGPEDRGTVQIDAANYLRSNPTTSPSEKLASKRLSRDQDALAWLRSLAPKSPQENIRFSLSAAADPGGLIWKFDLQPAAVDVSGCDPTDVILLAKQRLEASQRQQCAATPASEQGGAPGGR